MSLSQRFEDHCPELVAGDIHFSDNRLVFVSASGIQISLPSNARLILDLCDGSHSVRQIATQMLSEGQTLSLRLLINTLKSLKKARLLTDTTSWPELDDGDKRPQTTRSWWRRKLLAVPLGRSGGANTSAHGFFSFIAVLLIAGGLYRLVHFVTLVCACGFFKAKRELFFRYHFPSLRHFSVPNRQRTVPRTHDKKYDRTKNPLMVLELQPLGLAIETNAHQVWVHRSNIWVSLSPRV